MATNQAPIVEQMPATSRRRAWRVFFAGVAVGCLLPFALAVFYGPKSKGTYEDPLTGRRKHESRWLELTLDVQIEENEVSKWADRNSIRGTYPAQYGWTMITGEWHAPAELIEGQCPWLHARPSKTQGVPPGRIRFSTAVA